MSKICSKSTMNISDLCYVQQCCMDDNNDNIDSEYFCIMVARKTHSS